jgi:hypothetical protein
MRIGLTMSKARKQLLVLPLLFFVHSELVCACSCISATEEEYFAAAAYVAHIKVTAAILRPIQELKGEVPDIDDTVDKIPEYVRVSFDALAVFKNTGQLPPYLREIPFGPGNCMIGLMPGMEYVIYLDADAKGFTSLCSGSFGIFNREGTEVRPKLQRLREMAAPQPK